MYTHFETFSSIDLRLPIELRVAKFALRAMYEYKPIVPTLPMKIMPAKLLHICVITTNSSE